MALYALSTFDEAYYLQNNQDVVLAIASGAFSSALEHYQRFGEAEGRKPNAAFDPLFYLTNNSDVLNAVAQGAIPGALWHFENFGVFEGRQPSAAVPFDEAFYLLTNPDVAAAVDAGDFSSGWQHWIQYGAAEGRAPYDGYVPSIPGQTFNLTTGIDVIPGLVGSNGTTDNSGDDTVKGNSVTFTQGDIIDAGAGTDTLSLVLNESDTPYAGVFVSNVEHLVVRSIDVTDVDQARVSMTDFDDTLQTVTIVKSTGNTVIEDLQAGVDVVIDDVRGNVEIDFDNQNAPASVDVSVNEFGVSAGGADYSTLKIDNAVETVNISDDAAGPGFWNSFAVEGGFSELNVTGGANGTELGIGVMSTASNLDVDLTGNASDEKYVYIDMEHATQALNLATGDYSDVVEIYSDSFADSVTADLGQGDNWLAIGDETGTLDLTTGDGQDTVETGDVSYADIDLGEGNNSLEMDDVYSLNLTTGAGNDAVETNDVDYANIALGEGDNYLSMDDVYQLTLTTGDGVDDVSTENVWWANINLGHGDNDLWMDSVHTATIVTGDGTDYVFIGNDDSDWSYYGYRDLDISLGAGDDVLDLSGWWWWGGNGNGLETNSGVSDNHIIDGGEGNDTLRLRSLDQADADGTFAFVTSVETLQLDHGDYYWWWGGGGGSLDGVTTGANAAGVVNYEFLNGNRAGQDITLTNVVNNVTVRMDLNEYWDAEGQNFTLTQTPDDDANVANVHINLYDYYYWWNDKYFFGDITVDTTEVLNLSGSEYDYYWWWFEDTSLEIAGLYSADLTTLNLSGDLEFDFWNMVAPKLSLVDARGMTDTADIELNDVADAVTVLGGTGDDQIILKDASSALTADGGDGDDYIEGNVNDDVIHGGKGNDVLYAASGIDAVYGDEGDDLILWDAADLFAVDIVNGGDGYDTVDLDGSLGVQNDAFFYQWSGVERLYLDGGGNVLSLGIIASDAGLEEIHLSNTGATGDSLYFVQGWNNDTAIYLSDGNDTVVEAPSVGVDLRVYALDYQVTTADVLDGGNGNDTLYLTATNGTADLDAVTNFETLMVVANGDADIDIDTTDTTVAADATLTVDARALVFGDYDGNPATPATTGRLAFDGSAETDGKFVVWGGDGGDFITTGAGADTVNAGAGDNEVDAGAGNDVVTTGSGNDVILGGEGNDTINAGDGTNTVTGDGGRDIMTGGSGVDTYVYQLASDSSGLNYDTITNFQAGEKVTPETIVDVIDLTALGNVVFLGNFVNATLADTALQTGSGDLQVVYVTGEKFLYADFNDNGVIDDGDVAIELTGVNLMYADNLAA